MKTIKNDKNEIDEFVSECEKNAYIPIRYRLQYVKDFSHRMIVEGL